MAYADSRVKREGVLLVLFVMVWHVLLWLLMITFPKQINSNCHQ